MTEAAVDETYLPLNEGARVAQKLARVFALADEWLLGAVGFIGPHGTGKSHLLRIVSETAKRNQRRVVFLSAGDFTHTVETAVMRDSLEQDVWSGLRRAHVLCLDGFHDLTRLPQPFADEFDQFVWAGMRHSRLRVAFASTRDPREFVSNDAKLLNGPHTPLRLTREFARSGPMALSHPDYDARQWFAAEWAKRMGLDLPNGATELIAGGTETVLEVRTALHTLQACGAAEDLPSVRAALASQLLTPSVRVLDAPEVWRAVQVYFEVKRADLMREDKDARFIFPRRVLWYALRHALGLSFPAIARMVHRDHSTVMDGIRLIEKMRKQGVPYLTRALAHLERKLGVTWPG